MGRSLKCLSARFVIDIASANISTLDGVEVGLKCLSARFVIDITETWPDWETLMAGTSQMPFG